MKQERLISLDAFRGFTIAAMILVNDPGSWSHIYPQLDHAEWNGWTFTDLIFPFFLWIIGAAMTFSFSIRIAKGDSKEKLLLNILRRSVIIFLLGIFYNGFPFGLLWGHEFSWASIRVPGVLQRIAICYFISSVMYLYTSTRGQIIAIGALFISYWLMMFYIPVPGVGAGVFEPGKNFSAYVDSLIFKGHMWQETITWDPEGSISTIPAIVSVLFGAMTGDYLRRSQHSKEEKTCWMFVFGSGMLLLGVILDMWMPINKKMWTVSYTVLMGGWALCIFSIFYFMIDAKGIKKWAHPFVVYGMNAIFVYVLSCVFERFVDLFTFAYHGGTISLSDYLYTNILSSFASPINASLLYAIAWVLGLYLIVWMMWKRKWIVKV